MATRPLVHPKISRTMELESMLDGLSALAVVGLSVCMVRLMTGRAVDTYIGNVMVLGVMLMF